VSEFEVFLYCAAMGFVSAATISSFYQWVTSQRADFSVGQASLGSLVIAVLLSMFGGPFIIVQRVISGLRARELRAIPAALGVIVAGMWSVCAGIFYVGLLLSA